MVVLINMDKKAFVEYIKLLEFQDLIVQDWDSLGLNLIETSLYNNIWETISILEKQIFNEEGREWISWYLFERKSFTTGEILPWYDEEGNEHFCNNAEDLWEIVKDEQIIK